MKLVLVLVLTGVISIQKRSSALTLESSSTINEQILLHQTLTLPSPQSPENSFTRTTKNGTLETIICPTNTILDRQELVCKFTKTHTKDNNRRPNSLKFCPLNAVGLLPNPASCNSFYLCAQKVGRLLDCPDSLVFNNKTSSCDYPLVSDCCEFWEKDPTRIVQ